MRPLFAACTSSELVDPVGTLAGGELVLSVAVVPGDPASGIARYVGALRSAGAVGLMIELGST